MQQFETRFGHWVLRLRWPIIIITLVLVGLAASGGRNLSFTTSYRVFFSEDNPQLKAFDEVEQRYTKNDNVMFVLTPSDGSLFTPQTLAAIEQLTHEAWQIPFSIRVDSITNFQYTEAEEDELIVGDLVQDAIQYDAAALEQAHAIAIHEPLLVNRLISPSAHVTGVNVTIQLPGKDETSETPEVIAAVRAMAAQFELQYPHIDVRLSGMINMNNAFSEASMSDMQSLVPLSFLLIILFMMVLLRDFQRGPRVLAGVITALALIGALIVSGAAPALVSGLLAVAAFAILLWAFPATIGTVLVIMLSILAAMGIGGHLGFPMTPPSASAPTIILTVAIANSVHVLISMLHEMHIGRSKHEAIIESLRLNLQPVFLTSLTTTIGFLTMNFSEVPPFQHLGNFVAFGVISSFLLAVLFLPAIVSLLPIKMRVISADRDTLMERLGHWVVLKRTQLMWGMSALVLVLVAMLPLNQLNDVFLHYFDESIEFRADSDYTTENLTGLYIADYSLNAGESGGISEPEFLAEVEAFAEWYRAQPETMHVNVITDVWKRLNKNLHGDDPAFFVVPSDRELAAQYLLLYEMSLPYGLDLNNQIDVDKSSTRMTASLHTLSTNEMLALEQRAKQWLQQNTRYIRDAQATGPSMMFAHIGQRNIISMLQGTTIALLLISLILVFALRSIKIGIISLIPNLVPAAMGFGLWALLVGEVGLALSVVVTMTLGIVVDDTVHFLSKYLRARREQGLSAEESVRYAFTTVGRALVTTSTVLVVGFMVLSTSTFELNAGMGLLTAIVIIFALAADFLLLPPLLMKFDGRKS